MASAGLEVTATIRSCAAAIVVASDRYAVSKDAAVLETGEHAIGCAALSRFELAELQRLQLPAIVVLPSDALAATLDESAEGLELPVHLRTHLAGKPCVRFGDSRRLSQQLSELLSKLSNVGVLPAEDAVGGGEARDGKHAESNGSDHDGVIPEVLLRSQIAAQPEAQVRALQEWEREHAAAVEAAEERLHAAVAEHTGAHAALGSLKKKKDKAAAEAVLAAKAVLVNEARTALETIQRETPVHVTVLRASNSNPDNADAASATNQVQQQQTTQLSPSNCTSQSTTVGSDDKVGASSERASSVAAGRRVAALAADVRVTPAHEWELARAAEMQPVRDDDTALRDGSDSTVPLAKRLRHPELLLQQLQRHERILQRQNDRLYAAEMAASATETRVAASESALAAAQAHADSMEKFCFRQKGVNELRLQQAGEHDVRLLALESGLKVAVKRSEAVADLYADVLTELKRTTRATPEQAATAKALDLVPHDAGAVGSTGDLFTQELAGDGRLTPRSSSHTGGPEPTAEEPNAAIVWTVESDPGQYVTFPQRYASRITTAYFKRERIVELRSTPRPQGLTDMAANASPGRETTLAGEWSGWWSAFGSAPMQVDLCAMRMDELYPAAGRTKGWVLFGSWSDVLVKPLDDEIVTKINTVQRTSVHAAASADTVAAATSAQLNSATYSTQILGSSSPVRGGGTGGRLHASTVAIASAEKSEAVGHRFMQAMGIKSDGSLEHTLRELSSQVADLCVLSSTTRFI